MRGSWTGALVALALAGCYRESVPTEPEVPSLPPPARRVQIPDEPAVVHGEVDVVAAPVPTRFSGPFPSTEQGLTASGWHYTPWAYAHARLCRADRAVQTRVLDALRASARDALLTGWPEGTADGTYHQVLSWCRTDEPCRWLAEVATSEDDPAVSMFAWHEVASCPTEAVKPWVDRPDSPDAIAVQWYAMIGGMGDRLPDRLALAAERSSAWDPDELTTVIALARVLIRYEDPRVEAWFDTMLGQSVELDPELYLVLTDVIDRPWVRSRLRRPCRDLDLDCRPPGHPYDLYIFQDEPAFSNTAKSMQRGPLLARLEACVLSVATVAAFFRTRCLTRLADLDWSRAAALVPALADDRQDPELGPVLTTIEVLGAPPDAALRSIGMIGREPDPRAPLVEGLDAFTVMMRYGVATRVGTGVYHDAFEQAWAIHDLAALSPELRDAVFEVSAEPTGLQPDRRIEAYHRGRRYTHAFVQEQDIDGVRAMLAMLNAMLVDAEQPWRYAVVAMDDAGVDVVLADPGALGQARRWQLLSPFEL